MESKVNKVYSVIQKYCLGGFCPICNKRVRVALKLSRKDPRLDLPRAIKSASLRHCVKKHGKLRCILSDIYVFKNGHVFTSRRGQTRKKIKKIKTSEGS